MQVVALTLSIVAIVIAVIGANAAVSSARSAQRSAVEARRSRLDELGPRLHLDLLAGARERWNLYPWGGRDLLPPGIASPGTEFNSPGQLDVHLLIGASITVTNEGPSSAQLEADATRVDALPRGDGIVLILNPPSHPEPGTWVRDRRVTIAPGQTVELFLRSGPTLREWIAQGDQPVRVTIIGWSATDGARQKWALTLSTQLLTADQNNSSRFTIRSHAMIDAALVELPRDYQD